jgi:hypothetical protein
VRRRFDNALFVFAKYRCSGPAPEGWQIPAMILSVAARTMSNIVPPS